MISLIILLFTAAKFKLFNKSICPDDLVLLAKADALGRTVNQEYSPKEEYLKNALKDFYNNKEN